MTKDLHIGSDVEIARMISNEFLERHGQFVYDEGRFWVFQNTQWIEVTDYHLRGRVQDYDGLKYEVGRSEQTIKLNRSRIDSILHELAFMLHATGFFRDPQIGINCRNGFITFNEKGDPELLPHDPNHRQRFTIDAHWSPGYAIEKHEASLLDRLLTGCFAGDPDQTEKIDLISEIAGAAALSIVTTLAEPKAFVFVGPLAGNGKSQVLNLLRGLLPVDATTSIAAHRLGDEKHLCALAGKLLNANDELSRSDAIASEQFKSVVTGDPVTARPVYRMPVQFSPKALHVFATNSFTPFSGGMDRGIQRRLIVVPFNRQIPQEERVPNIGKRIGEEELKSLLRFAVKGASALMRRGAFLEPQSSLDAKEEWLLTTSPIVAWLEFGDVVPTNRAILKVCYVRDAYAEFRIWALQEGYQERSIPGVANFSQKVQAAGKGIRNPLSRSPKGARLVGLNCAKSFVWREIDNNQNEGCEDDDMEDI